MFNEEHDHNCSLHYHAHAKCDCTRKTAEPTCTINGVFSIGGWLAACGQHGAGNRCFHLGDCEHKEGDRQDD